MNRSFGFVSKIATHNIYLKDGKSPIGIYIIITGVGLSVRLSVRHVSNRFKPTSRQPISNPSTDLESL